MNNINETYRKLAEKVLITGHKIPNKKRKTTRLEIPTYQLKHDMTKGFPILGSKRTPFKSIVGELIWFLRGDNDIKYLNDNNIPIWNKDAYNWHVKEHTELGLPPMTKMEFMKFAHEGNSSSVGHNYSVTWNDFEGVNQIDYIIDGMKKDIYSSRNKLVAWHPAKLKETTLPPCHDGFQIIGVPLTMDQRIEWLRKQTLSSFAGVSVHVDNIIKQNSRRKWFGLFGEKELTLDSLDAVNKWLNEYNVPVSGFHLVWNQRSVDLFLGLPFNITSYATLGEYLSKLTGYPFMQLVGNLQCVHFYENQIESAKKLIKRSTDFKPCTLNINKVTRNFNNLQIHNFELIGYESNKRMNVEMVAPTEI